MQSLCKTHYPSSPPLYFPASRQVADKGGDRMDLFLERERAASSEPYIDDRVISFAATLPPLPHPYTVFCTAFEPGVEGLFRLTAKVGLIVLCACVCV